MCLGLFVMGAGEVINDCVICGEFRISEMIDAIPDYSKEAFFTAVIVTVIIGMISFAYFIFT